MSFICHPGHTLSLSPDALVADLSMLSSSISENSCWNSSPTDCLRTQNQNYIIPIDSSHIYSSKDKVNVCLSHVDDERVCKVAERPGGLRADVGWAVVQSSEDGVGCVCHEHHILWRWHKMTDSLSANVAIRNLCWLYKGVILIVQIYIFTCKT